MTVTLIPGVPLIVRDRRVRALWAHSANAPDVTPEPVIPGVRVVGVLALVAKDRHMTVVTIITRGVPEKTQIQNNRHNQYSQCRPCDPHWLRIRHNRYCLP